MRKINQTQDFDESITEIRSATSRIWGASLMLMLNAPPQKDAKKYSPELLSRLREVSEDQRVLKQALSNGLTSSGRQNRSRNDYLSKLYSEVKDAIDTSSHLFEKYGFDNEQVFA
jgi:hypothetical protein